MTSKAGCAGCGRGVVEVAEGDLILHLHLVPITSQGTDDMGGFSSLAHP